MNYKNSAYWMSYPLTDEEEQAINIDLKWKETTHNEQGNDPISFVVDDVIKFSKTLITIGDKEIPKEKFGNYLIAGETYAGRATYQTRAICLLYTIFWKRKKYSDYDIDITNDMFISLFVNTYSNLFPNKKIKRISSWSSGEKSAILNIAKQLLNDHGHPRKLVYDGNDVTISQWSD